MVAEPKLKVVPKEYGFHELANVFPLMEGAEFDRLVADIKARGLREHILIYDDQILDGRNRYRGCVAADVTPLFRPYDGDDPVGEVISRNLERRHLDESQRAMAAAALANLGRGNPTGANQHAGGNRPIGRFPNQPEAAKRMGVGTRTVTRARAVLENGAPELIKAVQARKVKLGAAEILARAPLAQQQAAVAGGKKAVADAVKEIKGEQAATATGQFDLHLAIKAVMHEVRSHASRWPKAHKAGLIELAKELRSFADTLDKRAVK